MNARCRPGQKTGCHSVEEFFRVVAVYYMLLVLTQRQEGQ